MTFIRKASERDLARIAEIEIFNYRMYFYPIFKNDDFYFSFLQVPSLMENYRAETSHIWVYDDGAVKGFVSVSGGHMHKLFVEPILHGKGIGSALLDFAVSELHAESLWALEKNTCAIAFYERHGFIKTSERKPEEDTDEYLVLMKHSR